MNKDLQKYQHLMGKATALVQAKLTELTDGTVILTSAEDLASANRNIKRMKDFLAEPSITEFNKLIQNIRY